MQFEELLREREQEGWDEGRKEGWKEGRREGRQDGINCILKLTAAMMEAGESNQISRLSAEPEFLKAMLEKYHLEPAE